MPDGSPTTIENRPTVDGWPIRALWAKYEDIAMHFNDLLIRLRMQALAGVTALSAVVGIFPNTHVANLETAWAIAAFAFAALCLIWIAIWILDLSYYNRLLIGSVAALIELEELSRSRTRIHHINVSTRIAEAVEGSLVTARGPKGRARLLRGVWWFYFIVLFVLVSGLAFSLHKLFA
jgi:hypothetical protein